MRQRFEQKWEDQERVDKNQIGTKSRKSKISGRSSDGGEQRYPERVILLTKGKKIPWGFISLNHGGFRAPALHAAAAKLQSENLGT